MVAHLGRRAYPNSGEVVVVLVVLVGRELDGGPDLRRSSQKATGNRAPSLACSAYYGNGGEGTGG
jgi:hypothetical protein